MKTTADYLDDLQKKFGINSDYALAKRMGWHRQQVSHYRLLKGAFDDETGIKIAAILEIDPAAVLLDMHAQRAKNEDVKNVWKKIAEQLGGVAAALAVLSFLPLSMGGTGTAHANDFFGNHEITSYTLCEVMDMSGIRGPTGCSGPLRPGYDDVLLVRP
jgi:N-acyl-D-aspartate/D-glutamate deacylase